MSKKICEYDEVYYNNKSHRVWSITPPYIEISERHKDRAIISSRSESFKIKITDLDMFKK